MAVESLSFTKFLYSQDLSNCKTHSLLILPPPLFLYSQDLSNCKTEDNRFTWNIKFLYSQDLSNCKTRTVPWSLGT